MKYLDISYGNERGLQQAIDSSAELLQNCRYIEEKKIISSFFNEIAIDSEKYCYGVSDTMYALKAGAINILICWESLSEITNEMNDCSNENDIYSNLLLEWLIKNYKNFGINLEIVNDNTIEGKQFVKGFGGIGAILRYKMKFPEINDAE